MRRLLGDYLQLIPAATLIVVFDQWTKRMVDENLALGEAWAPWDWLLPYARLVHWSNTGSAFGMFQNLGTVFAILAVVVALFIIIYYPRIERQDWLVRLALILQLGGAVGNLVDRIRQGYVTDFISIGNFAVFNIADACISVGVVVLVIGMYVKDNRQKREILEAEGRMASVEPAEQWMHDGSGE